MKDFCKEIGFWRRVWKIFAQHQFRVEPSARVRRTSCALNKMHSCTSCESRHYLPGPSMNAWMSVTSESLTTIRIPSGGSLINSSCSLTILRMVCGDRFSTFEIYNRKKSDANVWTARRALHATSADLRNSWLHTVGGGGWCGTSGKSLLAASAVGAATPRNIVVVRRVRTVAIGDNDCSGRAAPAERSQTECTVRRRRRRRYQSSHVTRTDGIGTRTKVAILTIHIPLPSTTHGRRANGILNLPILKRNGPYVPGRHPWGGPDHGGRVRSTTDDANTTKTVRTFVSSRRRVRRLRKADDVTFRFLFHEPPLPRSDGRTMTVRRRGGPRPWGRGRGWQRNFVERTCKKWRRNFVVRLFSGQIRILRQCTARIYGAGGRVGGARRAGWVYVETWRIFFFFY